jgi:hypothetical protein
MGILVTLSRSVENQKGIILTNCSGIYPCGILNFTQPYRPPRPVTGVARLGVPKRSKSLLRRADARLSDTTTIQFPRWAAWVSLRRTRETLTIWLAYSLGRHTRHCVRCGAAYTGNFSVCCSRSVRSSFEDDCPADNYMAHAFHVV